MQTSDYLTQLQQDKQNLVDNLTEKGIEGLTGDETFTELVPEVLNIPSGGADEYFTPSISYLSDTEFSWKYTLYKFPAITLNGTSCRYLFYNAPFVKIDVSKFNTSNVTKFEYMFNKCSKLTEIIGIENFDLNSLGDSGLSSMFEDCSKLTTLNLNGWKNTQKISSNSRLIFNNCSSLQTLYINDWNVSNCTSFQGWFAGCKKLISLDLSNWTNTKSTNHFYMFGGCTNLQTLDVRNMNFSQSQSYDYMLDKVPTNCLIIVKNQTEKDWFNTKFPSLTNIQTVEEYESN